MTEKEHTIIERFKRHLEESNLRNLTIQDWTDIFSNELSLTFTTTIYSIDFKYLYRARHNLDNGKPIDFFNRATDLWARPDHDSIKQGRCNLKGQSLLYTSCLDPKITFFELQPKTNTEMTIMEYETCGEIGILGAVGVKDIMKVGNGFDTLFNGHFAKSTKESILLDDILSNTFKSRADNTYNYPIYNLTNAITQIFLNDQKADFIREARKPKQLSGLIYPSVKTDFTGINVALNPNAVKNLLNPNIAYKYKIIERVDEHHFKILLTHQTKCIGDREELQWEENPTQSIEFITDLPI